MLPLAASLIAFSLLVQGCAGSSDTAQSYDPCNQSAVFSGQETVNQYKAACPEEAKNAAAPTYPSTPASAGEAIKQGRGILGSTDSEWNAVHTADPNAMSGVAYDPSPGAYPDNADRFVAVNHDAGRVSGFDESLPPASDIRRAVKMAMQMVPRDAHHGPVNVLDTCAAMGITSKTLQSELGSANAVAFFTSGTAGDHYDAHNVGDFSITPGETVPTSC